MDRKCYKKSYNNEYNKLDINYISFCITVQITIQIIVHWPHQTKNEFEWLAKAVKDHALHCKFCLSYSVNQRTVSPYFGRSVYGAFSQNIDLSKEGHHLKHLHVLLCENWLLHTFTSKGKSVQKLTLGITSFPVAPLRYLLQRIPATRYTTSKEIKLQRKQFQNEICF